jgi:hypothetical protein
VALQASRDLHDGHHSVDLWRSSGFYEYYQIGSDDEADDTEDGSGKSRELIATGLNSPWGMLYQFAKESGWSMHDILWKVSRANLLLMMADRPNFKKRSEVTQKGEGQELASMLASKFSNGTD